MAIDVDIEVDIPDNQDEIVRDLLGLGELKWTDTSFKDNVKEISTSLRVSLSHIVESRNSHNEIFTKEKQLKKDLEKELTATGLSEESSYALYKFALMRCDVLNIIVVYTTLQTKILVDGMNELEKLLNRAFEYGAVRQKVDNEMQLLKDLKEVVQELVKSLSKDRIEMQDQYFKAIENYNKKIVDMTRDVNNIPIPERNSIFDKKLDTDQKTLNELYELREYKKNHPEEPPLKHENKSGTQPNEGGDGKNETVTTSFFKKGA